MFAVGPGDDVRSWREVRDRAHAHLASDQLSCRCSSAPTELSHVQPQRRSKDARSVPGADGDNGWRVPYGRVDHGSLELGTIGGLTRKSAGPNSPEGKTS